jgi:hypothetical protein
VQSGDHNGQKRVSETVAGRLHRGALWFLFAGVLLVPKTLALRRKPRTWNALRLTVSLAAATLAAAAWMWAPESHTRTFAMIVGTVFVLLALLIPPEHQRPSVDARSRQLGALVVVKGGDYRAPASAAETEALLFIGPERLSILDSSLRMLSEVTLTEVTHLRAEPTEDGWKLHLAAANGSADFFYRGPFAEHFARVAESTVRSQLPVRPSLLPIVR